MKKHVALILTISFFAFAAAQEKEAKQIDSAMSELESDLTDKVILLADSRYGKALSKEEGSLRLIVSDEKKQAR